MSGSMFSNDLKMNASVEDIDSNTRMIRKNMEVSINHAINATNLVNRVSEIWKGESSKIYVQKNDELVSRLKKYLNELNSVCSAFENVSSSLQETESELQNDFINFE